MLARIDALKVPRWSVWMGGLSYSLYLVHVYVFELLQGIVTAVGLSHPAFEIVLFVTRPVMAVLCAWMLFRHVEMPLSTWVRERLLRLRLPGKLRARSAPAA